MENEPFKCPSCGSENVWISEDNLFVCEDCQLILQFEEEPEDE